MTQFQDVSRWHDEVVDVVRAGGRFAGMFSTSEFGAARLVAIIEGADGFATLETRITAGEEHRYEYPSLSLEVAPAFWYERAVQDLSGLVPVGHPRPDPLLLPVPPGGARPLPGGPCGTGDISIEARRPAPVDVRGHGMFALAFGPVRSGVFESIEFLLETPGEDIPHLNVRPHFKHRGVAKRFEGLAPADGVLVAERVEGIASVAHALAFSHAIETASGTTVPPRARLERVILAELERIANHLDVVMRLCDAAGLAVATSRFGWHKEETMRVMSRVSGSRFGRGAILPGGVRTGLVLPNEATRQQLRELDLRIRDDARRLMATPSFLDRIRGTGILEPGYARRWALLGPVGRASGQAIDDRRDHPYDGYPDLGLPDGPAAEIDGDVRARLRVRLNEIETSFELVLKACAVLDAQHGFSPSLIEPGPVADGLWLGWAEAPQGEAVYAVVTEHGRIARCYARSASFHNLVAFHHAFHTDVFTDFPFIEASFGLGYAGVAM